MQPHLVHHGSDIVNQNFKKAQKRQNVKVSELMLMCNVHLFIENKQLNNRNLQCNIYCVYTKTNFMAKHRILNLQTLRL